MHTSIAERRTLIVLLMLTAAESLPIVEALFGVRVIGFWPLGTVLTTPASPLGWLLGALVALTFCAFTISRNPPIRAHLLDITWLKVAAIAMALASGITEELFFRGALMNLFAAHGAAILVQILLSGLVFGAVHIVWIGFTGPRGIASVLAATTTLGIALAIVFLVSGRSVVPCVAAHVLINLVLEPWLILTAASHRWNTRAA